MEKNEIITVHNMLILDESGSMGSIYHQALTGANETIQSTRAAQERYPDQDHRFTFVTFNTDTPRIKTVIDDQPVGDVDELSLVAPVIELVHLFLQLYNVIGYPPPVPTTEACQTLEEE